MNNSKDAIKMEIATELCANVEFEQFVKDKRTMN